MNSKTKNLVLASMLAALCCIATMVIKFPLPFKGYFNLGDCVVLLAAWILPPAYGFAAAGIGSGLADLFLGYISYAPVTFVIKGVMALIAYFCHKSIHSKIGVLPSRIIGGVLAEITMVLGYYVFEGFLYGFIASIVNIPANAIQGLAGLVVGLILVKLFGKVIKK